MKTDLSIIIPTKDRIAILTKSLENLIQSTKNINAEILVINDSKGNLIDSNVFDGKVTVHNNPKSGVASARNYGASKAKSSSILFLDDDIILNESNINTILKLLSQDPNNCYLLNWEYPLELTDKIKSTQFGRFLIKNNLTSLKGWVKDAKWSENRIMEIKIGASYCLPISKKTFESINGYNENFPHAGAEDYDFCSRLGNAGIKFLIYPMSTVYHNEEDRVELKKWLKRKERDSETRKIASDMGYDYFKLYFSIYKKILLISMLPFTSIYFILIKLIPNKKWTDSFYGKVIHILSAIYIYKGYSKR